MTVRELIEKLKRCDDLNMEVRIAQPTHNHWNQILATPIKHVTPDMPVRHSAYNDGDIIDDEGEPKSTPTLVVLID